MTQVNYAPSRHEQPPRNPHQARSKQRRTPLQISQLIHDSLKVSSVSGCCFSSHPSQMSALPALPALPTRMIHTNTTKQPEQATTGMHEHQRETRLTHASMQLKHLLIPTRRLSLPQIGNLCQASYTAQVIEPFNVPTNSRRGCFQLDHPCRLGPLLHTLPTSPT